MRLSYLDKKNELFQKKTGVSDKGDVSARIKHHPAYAGQRFIGKIDIFPEAYAKCDNCFFEVRAYLCTIFEPHPIINTHCSEIQGDLH
jgi:hypothetical protein